MARKRDIGVLEDVRHPACAIVVLDQRVLAHDLAAVGVLGRRDPILDHLEYIRIRGQGEHAHHQALDARRDDEPVARVREMVQEIAIEEVLAGLLQSDHRVQLGGGLVLEHGAQERDIGGRHFHVDQKI